MCVITIYMYLILTGRSGAFKKAQKEGAKERHKATAASVNGNTNVETARGGRGDEAGRTEDESIGGDDQEENSLIGPRTRSVTSQRSSISGMRYSLRARP